MPKLLYITARMTNPPIGGRALLSRLHHDCLTDLLGPDLMVHELEPSSQRGRLASAMQGFLDGITPAVESEILARVQAKGVQRVYLDGSNLGRLAGTIKRRFPAVEVLTFFHNVEATFFLGAVRQLRSLRSVAVLVANYLAERKAVRWSDRRVTLSRRDSDGLAKIYGRAGTDILPMAMEDKLPAAPDGAGRASGDRKAPYALFVGGAFYANVSGVKWFTREVAPRISLQTCVVGRGLEAYREELEGIANVQVVGPVERLDQWYGDAKLVIAPVFDGSGMKTKVAEALMFGKRIVGTAEAFSGYEEVQPHVGWLCETEEDFISVLNGVEAMELPAFDPALRAIYENNYSREATRARLAAILGLESGTGRTEK